MLAACSPLRRSSFFKITKNTWKQNVHSVRFPITSVDMLLHMRLQALCSGRVGTKPIIMTFYRIDISVDVFNMNGMGRQSVPNRPVLLRDGRTCVHSHHRRPRQYGSHLCNHVIFILHTGSQPNVLPDTRIVGTVSRNILSSGHSLVLNTFGNQRLNQSLGLGCWHISQPQGNTNLHADSTHLTFSTHGYYRGRQEVMCR